MITDAEIIEKWIKLRDFGPMTGAATKFIQNRMTEGKVPDAAKLLPNEWQSPGNALVLVGPQCRSLAGTAAQRVFQTDANDMDELNPNDHLEFLRAMAALPEGLLHSGVPIGPGGLMSVLARGALSSGLGVAVSDLALDGEQWLKEHRCGVLVEVAMDSLTELVELPDGCTAVARIIDEQRVIRFGDTNILTNQAISAWGM